MATIYYDAQCGFCRRMLRIVLRWDDRGELVPIALDTPQAINDLAMDETTRMASWHLRTPDGTVYSGGAAFPPLLDLVGRLHWVARLLRRWPNPTDRVYMWIADHRVLFGRLTRRLPDLDSA